MTGRHAPVAADSLESGATKLLGQPPGGGLNSQAEVVRELVEVGNDVLPDNPSALVRRHRIELFGSDHPRGVSHAHENIGDGVPTEVFTCWAMIEPVPPFAHRTVATLGLVQPEKVPYLERDSRVARQVPISTTQVAGVGCRIRLIC